MMTTKATKRTPTSRAADRFGSEGLLTKSEAARLLRCSIRKLEMDIGAGKIAARKNGRRVLVCRRSVDTFLANLPSA